MIPYLLLVLALLIAGAIVVGFVRPNRADVNKCIGCIHAITCDRGDPDHICHKD